jgi:indolepyruvate ferredoxin oxidoreductase, beta subunit
MSSEQSVINIVLAGVGGQGSVRAGQIIARAAVLDGRQVATSEVHGMAQRGGSVFSSVRLGQEVYSPVIPKGEAQFLLAFELLEAVRYLPHLCPGGTALVNEQRITPTIEALKNAPYPQEVEALLRARAGRALIVPGLARAEALGNPRLANAVVLGALSTFLTLPEGGWRQALSELVPPQTVELNLRAFDEGVTFAQAQTDAA